MSSSSPSPSRPSPWQSLAWSPSSAVPLLASANSAGAVSVISLPHRTLTGSAPSSPYDLAPPPHTHTLTPPRQTRATTALAFSPPSQDGHKRVLLAQGFTKIRADSSVMVWDVAAMHPSADDGRPTESRSVDGRARGGGFLIPSDPSAGTSGDGFGSGAGPSERRPTPAFSLVPTENVTALEWMDDNVLAVGTQRQYIRLYDFRAPNPGQAVLQFGPLGGQGATSSSSSAPLASPGGASQPASSLGSLGGRLHASGIQRDPFSDNRLAAYDAGLPIAALLGTDYKSSLRDGSRSADANDGPTSGGPVRIWDKRSPRAELFRLEGPTVGAKTGGQLRSGAIGVKWDPEKAGRLVVLERAGDLSVWDTVDPSEGSTHGPTDAAEGTTSLVVHGEPTRSEYPADRLIRHLALRRSIRLSADPNLICSSSSRSLCEPDVSSDVLVRARYKPWRRRGRAGVSTGDLLARTRRGGPLAPGHPTHSRESNRLYGRLDSLG